VKGNGITMAPRLRILLFLALSLLLTACAPAPGASESSPTAPPPSPSATPEAVTTYPLIVTDDAGREVTVAADPERIVSLAPSNTEIACALGSCDQLVGVTDFDDYPPEVAGVEKVVVFAQVDVEKVVAAEPDLVLAAGNELTPTAVIDQLTELGVTVLVLYPESLDEVYANVEMVGQALDEQVAASELVDGMRARVEAVEDAVAGAERPRTFYEVSIFEGSIYTAGDGSFIASLIETAGGEPITGDALSTSIALEDLVAADPALILLGDAAYDATVTPESVAARPGWGEMTAVRDGRILPMLEDVVVTRPGPRIVDGLEALARAIHPDRFD
jgi:iron complex transport system substrate-binding protein